MKNIFLLLLILSLNSVSAQIDTKLLQKDWFITNTLMKDGSKPFLKKESFMLNYGLRVESDYYKMDEIIHFLEKTNIRFTIY